MSTLFAVFICVIYGLLLAAIQQYGTRKQYLACLAFACVIAFALGFTL